MVGSTKLPKERAMDWKKDAAGNIRVFPVQSFDLYRLWGSAVGLRLQVLREESENPLEPHQFALSPKVARELAEDLAKAAEACEQLPPEGTPRN